MKFLGLFFMCFFLIVIGISLLSFLNIWGLIALVAFLMAMVLRIYLDLDERLEAIEQKLGLTEEPPTKTFSEQINTDKENTP